MRRLLRYLAGALGVLLFVWFVREAGPARIVAAFIDLGPWFPVLLVPYAGVYLFDTIGWAYAFPSATGSQLSAYDLFRIRTAGEAVNNLVPSAYLAGEPVKVYLATKRGVGSMVGAQSVVVAKTTMTLAELLFIMIGSLAALASLEPTDPAYRAMLVTTAVAAGVVVLLFWLQRRGLFGSLLALAQRVGLARRKRNERARSWAEIDRMIMEFYRRDRRRFFASTFWHLVGWLAGAGEIALACMALGSPIPWSQAIAIEAFAAVAKGIGAFAPGSIGVQESSIVLLFRVFGIPDTVSIPYAVIRRGREVVWVACGTLLLMREEASLAGVRAWLRSDHEAGV